MNIVIGIIGLNTIIFVHEIGHLLAARYCHIRVLEFAVGIGPVLYSFMWGSTRYSIRMLPLGGFCKLEDPLHDDARYSSLSEPLPKKKGSFQALSIGKKILVLGAGPLANILWYIVLSLLLFFSQYTIKDYPAIVDPIDGTPAAEADLQRGDIITSIEDIPLRSFSHMARVALQHRGKRVQIEYRRNGNIQSTTVRLNANGPALGVHLFIPPHIQKTKSTPGDYFRDGDRILRVGKVTVENAAFFASILEKYKGTTVPFVVLREGRERSFPLSLASNAPFARLVQEQNIEFPTVDVPQWSSFGDFTLSLVQQIGSATTSTVSAIARLLSFRTKGLSEEAMGPLRVIAFIGSDSIATLQTNGFFSAFFRFVRISALLSLAIAIMNLIPIPILDGGHIVFHIYHFLLKKEPTYRGVRRFQFVGAVILLFLFAFVLFGDVVHLIAR